MTYYRLRKSFGHQRSNQDFVTTAFFVENFLPTAKSKFWSPTTDWRDSRYSLHNDCFISQNKYINFALEQQE